MAIPEDHLEKFHKITDAKDMWEAIKSRFGGNDESKKMQKYILKQQFESVSTEDANQKFLKDFIRQIENQLNQKVKTIRCDNGTEFKNMDII
ncbi:hypothetical protein Tco_0320577 [Tanacetum coccineum]